jgi:hypothetical protein
LYGRSVSAYGLAMEPTRGVLFALLLGSTAGLLGCDITPQMPGTMLGTYKVTAQSETNTCGISAPNPWTFDVRLSKDGTKIYWDWMDGSPYLSGPLTSSQATLTSSVLEDVDGTDAGPGPCNMSRADTITVTLPSGSSPGSFTGTIAYAFAASTGANCSDQLTSGGGAYSELPCSITYATSAARQ